jgi:hypothetical protein
MKMGYKLAKNKCGHTHCTTKDRTYPLSCRNQFVDLIVECRELKTHSQRMHPHTTLWSPNLSCWDSTNTHNGIEGASNGGHGKAKALKKIRVWFIDRKPLLKAKRKDWVDLSLGL